jgi:PEP-CTERM motif
LSWGISIFKPFSIYQGVITMKQIFKSKPSYTADLFKTTTLAATLATAMFASSVQADVIVTSARRIMFADNSQLAQLNDTSTDLSGIYNKTLSRVSQSGPDVDVAIATQNSNIGAQFFTGTSTADVGYTFGGETFAQTLFEVFFTLTESYNVIASARVAGDSSDGFNHNTFFNFTDIGGTGISLKHSSFEQQQGSVAQAFSRTLSAGDYTLNAGANSSGFRSDIRTGSSSSRFDFAVVLTELDDTPPSNNVPEPGSLALMGAGVLAAAASRRKWPLQLTHA